MVAEVVMDAKIMVEGDVVMVEETYLGSYTPEQWKKLSAEDRRKVHEGRQKSAEQQAQTGNNLQGQGTTRNIVAIIADSDTPSGITIPTMLLTPANNDVSTTGDKHSNPKNAGSFMS